MLAQGWRSPRTNCTYSTGISTNETVQYFNVLCCEYIHVKDPGQALINDYFTVVIMSLRVPARNELVQYGTF